MNSAVITKVEYKLPEDLNFSVIDFVPQSGKMNEEPKATGAGTIYTTIIEFNIAGLSVVADELVKRLNNRKAYFKLTDSEGLVYNVGSENFAARFLAKSALDGSPGSFRGYRCFITLNSTSGCIVE